MSLTARVSFSSAAILPSACLRCCRIPWAFSWSCQKAGSLAFASRASRRSRLVATSKIAPHEIDAFFQFVEAELKVFDVLDCRHKLILYGKREIRKVLVSFPPPPFRHNFRFANYTDKRSCLSSPTRFLRAWAHARLVHIEVVCCNHVPRIGLLHLLQHLFFAPGLEATRGVGLVAAGVATMGKYEQERLGTGCDVG